MGLGPGAVAGTQLGGRGAGTWTEAGGLKSGWWLLLRVLRIGPGTCVLSTRGNTQPFNPSFACPFGAYKEFQRKQEDCSKDFPASKLAHGQALNNLCADTTTGSSQKAGSHRPRQWLQKGGPPGRQTEAYPAAVPPPRHLSNFISALPAGCACVQEGIRCTPRTVAETLHKPKCAHR